MYPLDKALHELCRATDAMQQYAEDAVVQEAYRAALEAYRRHLEHRTEQAQAFLRSHQEANARVFRDALSYLDTAIRYANPGLAESALRLIEIMRETEPAMFERYYQIRFGK